jgi:hypothetical protein
VAAKTDVLLLVTTGVRTYRLICGIRVFILPELGGSFCTPGLNFQSTKWRVLQKFGLYQFKMNNAVISNHEYSISNFQLSYYSSEIGIL